MIKDSGGTYFNSDSSLLVGSVKIGSSVCSLYRTKSHKYKYVYSIGDDISESSVADVSFDVAKKWAKDNLSAEEYDKEFTIVASENKTLKISLFADGETYTVFERIRGNTGKTISEILVDMIDYYEQTHGSLNE